MRVSVIIPFQKASDYLWETLDHLQRLQHRDFEVVLISDIEMPDAEKTRARSHSYQIIFLSSGPVSPAIKRDMGAEACTGDILAFIDDDAYPAPDWLTAILPHFQNPEICGVGGPQVTPPHDGFWQKVSGATFLSFLNGPVTHRYWPDPSAPTETDDWPSVNLLVRKADFLAVGGFDSAYWPGEDTKLCRDLVLVLKKKILYEWRGVVFHHRRAGFLRHLKQIGNYGLHRGYFMKRFPETSLRIMYLVPSGFFLFATFGWLGPLQFPILWDLYFLVWLAYGGLQIASVFWLGSRLSNLRIAIATIPYIAGSHYWYGWRVLEGLLLTRNLQSRLGR